MNFGIQEDPFICSSIFYIPPSSVSHRGFSALTFSITLSTLLSII